MYLPIILEQRYIISCTTIICYRLTCYRLTCYQLTCYQTHLLLASLAIPSFAINSLAICFTSFRPHLRSDLNCSRHTCSPASLTIRPQLLSKRLFFRLNCYQFSSAIQNYPILIRCHQKKKNSKLVVIKTSSQLLS